MFKGIARAAVYLLLIVPLVVVTVLTTKHIQFAYDLRQRFVEAGNVQKGTPDMQQIMAANELSTRSFFLVFICFVMILCGLLITLKSTENAFAASEESKVKYSLRTAYPGIIMAIFGCLLLAYSVYQSSELQLSSTRQLMLLQRGGRSADTLYTKENNASILQTVRQHVADTLQPSVKPADIQTDVYKNEVLWNDRAVVQDPAFNTGQGKTNAVTPEDMRWATRLARQAIRDGLYPKAADNRRYNDIIRRLQTEQRSVSLDPELQWAFGLLRKAHGGYQPTAGEWQRYERIVGDQIGTWGKEGYSAGNY